MISAAILAGGKSRRMGTDKASLRLPGRGTLIEEIVERLRVVADEILIVANDDRFAALGLPIVPDRFPDSGSLGGIYSALVAARHEHCLVVACDMPFLSVPLLQHLSSQAAEADAVVPRIEGQPEPLHAIYRRLCARAIESRLRAGQFRIISFFSDVHVRYVDEDDLRRLDPDLRSFVNVNTPAEWQAALDELGERGSAG